MMKNPPHPGSIIGEDVLGELGLTVAEAAARLGVSRVTLSRVIHGRLCDIQHAEHAAEFRHMCTLHALLRARAIESFEALVAEAHYHQKNCIA